MFVCCMRNIIFSFMLLLSSILYAEYNEDDALIEATRNGNIEEVKALI